MDVSLGMSLQLYQPSVGGLYRPFRRALAEESCEVSMSGSQKQARFKCVAIAKDAAKLL